MTENIRLNDDDERIAPSSNTNFQNTLFNSFDKRPLEAYNATGS